MEGVKKFGYKEIDVCTVGCEFPQCPRSSMLLGLSGRPSVAFIPTDSS